MSAFVAMYRLPADPEAFEAAYRETHVPLVLATPGLTRIDLATVARTLLGEPALFLHATMHFASAEARADALRSPEWAAAGRNLAEIGGLELATMLLLHPVETLEPTG